jgi:hypothetical protein
MQDVMICIQTDDFEAWKTAAARRSPILSGRLLAHPAGVHPVRRQGDRQSLATRAPAAAKARKLISRLRPR